MLFIKPIWKFISTLNVVYIYILKGVHLNAQIRSLGCKWGCREAVQVHLCMATMVHKAGLGTVAALESMEDPLWGKRTEINFQF